MIKARVMTNVAMRDYCSEHNILYFTTETALKIKNPKKPIYMADNLHLSPDGAIYIKTYMAGKIGLLLGHTPPYFDL
jgi:hypothetical protein